MIHDHLTILLCGVYTLQSYFCFVRMMIKNEELDIHTDHAKIENIGGTFVTMPDGLWMLRDIVIKNDNHMNEMDSRDVVLFKIPEL